MSRPKPVRPSVPSVICGACGCGPDDCDCKPTVHVLENVTEWHATVQVSVEVAVDNEGGILPVGGRFEGRDLTAGELGEIDVGRISDALELAKREDILTTDASRRLHAEIKAASARGSR
jgi:hypothetical protein